MICVSLYPLNDREESTAEGEASYHLLDNIADARVFAALQLNDWLGSTRDAIIDAYGDPAEMEPGEEDPGIDRDADLLSVHELYGDAIHSALLAEPGMAVSSGRDEIRFAEVSA